MLAFTFEVRVTVKTPINRRLLARIATVASRVLPPLRGKTVSLAVVGDTTMARLHRQYRHRPGLTDVLSFSQTDRHWPTGEPTLLGEIVIDYPQVVRQARRAGQTVEAELSLLVIHGLIHLLGHDHERSRREAAVFNRLHQTMLRQLGFSPVI
ncbi:MAG: rRNA maturation RNase YbeY [Patescibacteria group bacterium]